MNIHTSKTSAFEGPAEEFATSIINGLSKPSKTIESKWLYDVVGSDLFEAITALEEYYPTRTETAILQQRAVELAPYISKNTALVELGSGSSTKTRILLGQLTDLFSYVPIDISSDFLHQAADDIARENPEIDVQPVVADFMQGISVPSSLKNADKLLFFPGSTIGNFEPSEAVRLLTMARDVPDVSGFVLGVDLVKSPERLIRAYDDSKGVTAAFNLNLLRRINRELEADFNLKAFRHEARWNPDHSRIEMHLVSMCDQTVTIASKPISFQAGESIHTENSHKYTRESLEELCDQSGWRMREFWTDANDLFAVCVLT